MIAISAAARLLAHSPTSLLERYAAAGAVAIGRSDAASGARAGLDRTMRELAAEVAARRLAAYREYVGATVDAVSPVLLRACELHGLDLDDLAWRMEPGGVWPQWLCGRRRWSAERLTRIAPDDPWRDPACRDRETFIHSGLVVRPGGDRRRALGVRVLGHGLDMGAVDPGSRLRTVGDRVELTVPHVFPETITLAMRGRPLDTVVEHPLCAGLGLVVVDAAERRRGTTLLTMRCEPVAWRFPWARGDGSGADADAGRDPRPSAPDTP